jgi:hypothetical protein
MDNLNKVYIVTNGCYSDKYNVGVFSSKELAEKYIKIHFKDINDACIESHILDPGGNNETVQECYYIEYHFYNGSYHFEKRYNKQYDYIKNTNMINNVKLSRHYIIGIYKDKYILSMTTLPSQNEDEFDIELRMMKVIQDKVTEIKSLIELEGWYWEMVEDYINDYKEELKVIEGLIVE